MTGSITGMTFAHFIASDSSGIAMKTVHTAQALQHSDHHGLSARPLSLSGIDGIAKRGFDFAAAFALLCLALPLFAMIAVLIKCQDRGPVLYRQTRCGKDRRAFGCWKFRTMRTDADRMLQAVLDSDPEARAQWTENRKLTDDPRVTRLGAFLRKSSLDELPQLVNVLVGEMSLIGPRPVTFDELGLYGRDVQFYLKARPGITGLWQVSGRSRLSYDTRIAFDAAYVQDWSFAGDLRILARTLPAVLKFDGAY